MKSIVRFLVAAVPALGLAGDFDVEDSLLRREAARLPDGLQVSFAAAEAKLVRYVEDLALWGCNQVRVWLDMHEVTGPDDPLTAVKVARLKMILPRFSALARRKFPGSTVNFATWRFDVFGDLGEWDGLFRRGEELRKYVDELTIERTDKIASGTPGGLPAASMAEISMGGMLPWGGYGANPRPKFVAKSIASAKGRLAGFRPYSEGIYEDMNKVLFLILGWDASKTWQRAVAEYSDFHFGKGVAEAIARRTGTSSFAVCPARAPSATSTPSI